MRKRIRIPALLALTLALAVPALAQSTPQHAPAGPGQMAMPAGQMAMPADPNKADLLHQEYVAKTAELHGKIKAREAELETQLATKPDDTAAVKKLTTDIAALRGQLYEQTTLFRVRYAKETGTPIRQTRGFGHKGGMMMEGMDKEGCMMMQGKGMMGGMDMGKGGMMGGMDMGKGMNMDMGKGKGMDMNNMQAPAKADEAKPADAAKGN